MLSNGTITSPGVVSAFRTTDRGHFLAKDGLPPLPEQEVYMDMPLRNGVLHLSAPSIYGAALEHLDLQEGHSFLNVGSGTGCASRQ